MVEIAAADSIMQESILEYTGMLWWLINFERVGWSKWGKVYRQRGDLLPTSLMFLTLYLVHLDRTCCLYEYYYPL